MCFGKVFHLILMRFIHHIQCFVECFQKSGWFSLKIYFSIFSIDPICFQSIENSFKILGEPSFSINRIPWIRFFLKQILTFSNLLFQKFLSFSLSLSLIRTWLHLGFLSFFIILFARFLSPNTGKTLLPFFLLLFSYFMHFSCILIWGFWTYTYLGFLMIRAIFSEINHWVLFLWCN